MTKNVRPVQFGRKNPHVVQKDSKIMTHYEYPFANGIVVELVIMLGGEYAFLRLRDYCGKNHIDKDQIRIDDMVPLREALDWAGHYPNRFEVGYRLDLIPEFKRRYGKKIIYQKEK